MVPVPGYRSVAAELSPDPVTGASYGIYLAHPFGIVLVRHFMGGQSPALQITAMVLLTAGFSIAGYHLLEFPMIRLGSRVANIAERRYEQRELSHYRVPPAIQG